MKTKLFKKLTSWTLTAAIVNAIRWTVYYIKDWNEVEESFHGRAFFMLLKKYLRMDPRIDWLGRVYGVVNPAITEDGTFDYNGMVFEMDGINTNNNTWVENWLYKQMILVTNVFDMQKSGMFDIIDVKVTHVGPENADNHLVVFDIASRKQMARFWKRTVWQSILYLTIFTTIYLVLI